MALALSAAVSQAQTPPQAPTSPSSMPTQSTPSNSGMVSGPLDNPILRQADQDQVPNDLFNRITFKYDHTTISSGSQRERLRVAGEQTLSQGDRIALGYEIPFFIQAHSGPGDQRGRGLGDMKLSFSGVLGKGEKFSNAAKVEFTFPSASDPTVGGGQNIVKLAWGFSRPLASRTVLNGILAYNKGLTARPGAKGDNSFEPEAVLAQAFSESVGAFLDWDTYQDFNAGRFGQTLKFGLEFQLDRSERWSLSPYAQFPLNHFTSSNNLKSETGFDLSYRY
jgi:hypothetical protein